MPGDSIRFEPNTPVRLKLADPLGDYDFDLRQGSFQTTDGRRVVLPRPAVEILYALEPGPGEEIQITRYLRGRRFEWDITLTPQSEKLRAAEEIAQAEAQDPQNLAQVLEASIQQAESRKPASGPPVLVKRGPKRAAAPNVDQPRLFDRGTGTDGPAPARAVPAAAASPTRARPAMLPWNVAFREVTAWIAKELQANNLQWCDESQKSMACTVLIAEVKAGRIGPWEREG